MTILTIATDGACLGNPGPGGWGYVALLGDEEINRASGSEEHTTNNRMEMRAAIEALYYAKIVLEISGSIEEITLISDSQYVIKGITEWIHGWKKKGWVTSAKKPVINKDLWVLLEVLNAQVNPTWQWVRGHDGHPLNEIADSLANTAAGL